jgi:hypothetical protein
LNLILGARLLVAELITWEAEYLEIFWVLGFDFLVEIFQAVILRGEATFGGGIND